MLHIIENLTKTGGTKQSVLFDSCVVAELMLPRSTVIL